MALEGEMVDAAPTAAERRMIMAKYIDREALVEWLKRIPLKDLSDGRGLCRVIFEEDFKRAIKKIPKGIIVDVAPVRHGRWVLEAHDERVNYRWNVTAECSECCDERKEIWAGFFPNIDPSIARSVALASAKSVKLSNYCPNCGADMRGSNDE